MFSWLVFSFFFAHLILPFPHVSCSVRFVSFRLLSLFLLQFYAEFFCCLTQKFMHANEFVYTFYDVSTVGQQVSMHIQRILFSYILPFFSHFAALVMGDDAGADFGRNFHFTTKQN